MPIQGWSRNRSRRSCLAIRRQEAMLYPAYYRSPRRKHFHQSLCPKNRMECKRRLTPDPVFAILLQAIGAIFSLKRF